METLNHNKKALVISNACFSMSDSNGRTIANLFGCFGKENLSQFYVYGEPDFDVCENYYKVSDKDALNSLVKFTEMGGIISARENKQENTIPSKEKKAKKTPFLMLVREIVWRVGRWEGKKLKNWIESINPDLIILVMGDNCFLPRLARKIASKNNIPVVAYSTESYAFKDFNYLTKRPSIFYWLFYKMLNYEYKKIEKHIKLAIFNTPLLAEEYEKRYSYPCKCMCVPSDIEYIKNTKVTDGVTVSYLGNMGVGRHKPLIEIAEALNKIIPGAKLDIYGNLPRDERASQELLNCEYIQYKGFVSYDDVVKIIHNSTLLVHAELDDEFYSKDLKYAFSTKIADSVCSGTPFLIYARDDLAETDFLTKNKCAFVATSKEQLFSVLNEALTNERKRQDIVENALKAKEEYFSGNIDVRGLINI